MRWVVWKGPLNCYGRANLWGHRQSDHGKIYFFQVPEIEDDQKGALLWKVKAGRMDRETYKKEKERAVVIGLV